MRRDWQSFFAHSDCFPPGRSSDFGGSLPADLQNTFAGARPNSVRPAKIPSTESASDYPLTVARLTSPRFYHDYRQCQHLITRLPQFRSSHNPYRRIRVGNRALTKKEPLSPRLSAALPPRIDAIETSPLGLGGLLTAFQQTPQTSEDAWQVRVTIS